MAGAVRRRRRRWSRRGDDVQPRRPGAVGRPPPTTACRWCATASSAGWPTTTGPVVVMLDGELGGDVIDLDQLAAGHDHQRRAAPRGRRPARRPELRQGLVTCGGPRPRRPASTSTGWCTSTATAPTPDASVDARRTSRAAASSTSLRALPLRRNGERGPRPRRRRSPTR